MISFVALDDPLVYYVLTSFPEGGYKDVFKRELTPCDHVVGPQDLFSTDLLPFLGS
jgi:hypothetical protein